MKIAKSKLKQIIQEELEEVQDQGYKTRAVGFGIGTIGAALSSTVVGAPVGTPMMGVGAAVLAVDKVLRWLAVKRLPFNEQGIVTTVDAIFKKGGPEAEPAAIAKVLAERLKEIKKNFKFLESAIEKAEGSDAAKKTAAAALKTSGHLLPDVSDRATQVSQAVTTAADAVANAPEAALSAVGAVGKHVTREQLKKIVKEALHGEGLGMYQHAPEEPISGDLLGQLEEIVEMWAAETPEGRAQEKQMLDLISRFTKPEQEYSWE